MKKFRVAFKMSFAHMQKVSLGSGLGKTEFYSEKKQKMDEKMFT